MSETIEISELDKRNEHYRLASAGAEKMLLFSIRSHGIRDPLQGVDVKGKHLLLDRFKRCHCAKALHIAMAPYRSMGSDEAAGVLERISIVNKSGKGERRAALALVFCPTTRKYRYSRIAP